MLIAFHWSKSILVFLSTFFPPFYYCCLRHKLYFFVGISHVSKQRINMDAIYAPYIYKALILLWLVFEIIFPIDNVFLFTTKFTTIILLGLKSWKLSSYPPVGHIRETLISMVVSHDRSNAYRDRAFKVQSFRNNKTIETLSFLFSSFIYSIHSPLKDEKKIEKRNLGPYCDNSPKILSTGGLATIKIEQRWWNHP